MRWRESRRPPPWAERPQTFRTFFRKWVARPVETCFNTYMSNAHATAAPATFKVGNTYSARSAADHDCVWTFKVSKRTAKFVTLVDQLTDETRRVGVYSWNGVEHAKPFGTYSMCPVLSADR